MDLTQLTDKYICEYVLEFLLEVGTYQKSKLNLSISMTKKHVWQYL